MVRVLKVIWYLYQLPNNKKIFKGCTRGMDNLDMKRLLATMALLIIAVPVAIEPNIDILSPSSHPRPPHSLSAVSHIDTKRKTQITVLKDEEEGCIKYCDKSCSEDGNENYKIYFIVKNFIYYFTVFGNNNCYLLVL
jgi:hypothetical protein